MDRQEVIELLTFLRENGEMGTPRWDALMRSIQTHGPIHDPEWVACTKCGDEFELPVVSLGRTPQMCTVCATDEQRSYDRTRHRAS